MTLGDSEGVDDFVVFLDGVDERVIVVVRFKGVRFSQSGVEFARLEGRAELFAQVCDMHHHGVFGAYRRLMPHGFVYPAAGQHEIFVFQKEKQNVVFL